MSTLKFNYSKLRGRIKEICGTNARFAKMLGVAETTLSAKLNNLNEFTQSEIFKAIKILGLTNADIPIYFFAT